jgi:uncharacterized membrane protein
LFLGVIPDLAINLLSAKSQQTTIYFQYTAGIVPFVLAASIVGASRLKRNPDRTSLAAVAAVACIAVVSPIYRVAVNDFTHALPSDSRSTAKSHALALIPSGVPVSASNQLGGLLSERRYIYLFPVEKNAAWLIVDARDPTYTDQDSYRHRVAAVNASSAWRVVFRSHDVEVLRKR